MTNATMHAPSLGSRKTPVSTRRPFVRGLMALACAASLLEFAAPAPAAQRQALNDQVPAAVKHLQPLKRLAGTNRLELVIALPLRNQEALTGLLGQQYDPASPYYRQYLTPAEFTERFGPSRAGLCGGDGLCQSQRPEGNWHASQSHAGGCERGRRGH